MRTMSFRSVRFACVSGGLLLSGLAGVAHAAVDCASLKPVVATTTNALQLSPIAVELAPPGAQVGSGVGFAGLFSEDLTVDVVTARAQRADCRAMASTAPPTGGYQGGSGDASAWRFNMTQNGKRMTADEFDAWMKARGIRVIPGPARTETAAAAPAPTPAPAAPPPKKKKR